MKRWTEKLAAARTRRRLKALQTAAEKNLRAIAYDYGDVDNTIVSACDEQLDFIAGCADDIEQLIADRLEGAA